MILYEVGTFLSQPAAAMAQPHRVVSFTLLERFFALFGWSSFIMPGMLIVAILLAWHVAANEPWWIDWRTPLLMTGESVIWGLPLLVLGRALQLTAGVYQPDLADRIVLSIGAGIYEELLFRLIMIELLSLLLIDLVHLPRNAALVFIIMLSSGAFAAHHYQPFGADVFRPVSFLFRTAAGIYLAAVYVLRGFGLAAGAHMVYDIVVVSLDALYA